MTVKRRRRFWSDEEKCRIVGQARVSGCSISEVARRYDVNANLVFKWLRDSRFIVGSDDRVFLPVEVSIDAPSIEPEPACPDVLGKIAISLAGGCRLELIGRFDPDSVVRLVRGLSR
mgnify:CR=1 FL=1